MADRPAPTEPAHAALVMPAVPTMADRPAYAGPAVARPVAARRRLRPVHLFAAAAVLQFAAIPLPWASARLFEGSVTVDGLEAAPFGACAAVAGLLAAAAGVAAARGARGWMLVWAGPAGVGSLLFGVAMLVLDSILANAIEWVFAERVAAADAGPAVWLVLASGVGTLVASGWALVAGPLPPHGRPPVLRATLTLPAALWRATRHHYRGTP